MRVSFYFFCWRRSRSHDLLDLPPGEKLRIQQLQVLAKDTKEWREIPQKDMEEMIACTVEFRSQKLKGSRSATTGHLTDVNSTFKRIEEEVSNPTSFE